MLSNLPYGQTPPGKSKFIFDDTPSISEKKWQQNIGNYIDLGVEIEYIGNSAGYRTKEWHETDWKNCIVFLGDSATYGHGSAEKHTIPKIIEQHTGITCVNMSVPGASSELLINISCVIINEINPKKVVLCHPSMPRIWDPIGSTGNLGPWLENTKGFAKESYDLYKSWTAVDQRLVHKCITNTLTLRTLWRDTSLIEWTWNQEVADLINVPYHKYFGHETKNLSRDGYHANFYIHTNIANEIVRCF
jgi:hypothetical protein